MYVADVGKTQKEEFSGTINIFFSTGKSWGYLLI